MDLNNESFYLINGEIRFFFAESNRTLTAGESTLTLRKQDSRTLKYILENHQSIIRSDELAKHLWGEAKVNLDYQNKKAQAVRNISTVRKHVESLGLNRDWLKTSENQGYTVCCEVVLFDTVELQKKHDEITKRNITLKNRFRIFLYSATSALITAIAIIALYFFSTADQLSIKNVAPLTSLSWVSVEPSFSPDGESIVFAHKTNVGSSKITLKHFRDINYISLTNGNYDQSPVFSPSGNMIAYQRKNKDTCEIRVITLNNDRTGVQSDIVATNCNQENGWSNIAWISNSEILFTDKARHDLPLSVYHLDLQTFNRTIFLNKSPDGYYGAGYYYISYDHETDELFLLDGKEWNNTDIYKLSANRHLSLLSSHDNTLFSIALFNGSLIFRDIDNQLKSFPIDEPSNINVVYPNPLKPIGNPVTSSKNGRIGFVSGEVFKADIHTYSLADGTTTEITSSNYKIRLPKTTGAELLFTSAESGITQIYSQTNERIALSDFKVNRNIVEFAGSKDRKWLAINFPTGTTLYRRTHKGLIVEQEFPNLIYPDFSLNSKRMLLSVPVGDDKKVIEFDLTERDDKGRIQESGIVIREARFAKYHKSGIIYVSTDKDGVHRFTFESNLPITTSIKPLDPERFALNDNFLFTSDRFGVFSKIDLSNGDVEIMPYKIFGQISAHGEIIYFTTQSLGKMDIILGDISSN